MVRAIPGDPAQILLGQNATQEQVHQLRASMGLDKPVFVQYGLFLRDAITGDLGESIVTGRPVTTELLVRFPATLELTAFAMFIAVLVGVPVGVISAVKQYSLLDKTTSVLALAGISMPIFWLAMILIVIFTVNLGRLTFRAPATAISWAVLIGSSPAVSVGAAWARQVPVSRTAASPRTIPMGIIMRMPTPCRSAALADAYVRTSRAKGCAPWPVGC